jgi:predicted nucleic acid-binding protein
MILVDTSIWIEVFRRNRPLDLKALVSLDEIVTCLPVVQEVLQGFKEERAFRIARDSMLAFPIVESPLSVDVYEEAIRAYRSARRLGVTVRSSTDCLIAACALRNELEVLHRDRDFTALARVTPLRQRQP